MHMMGLALKVCETRIQNCFHRGPGTSNFIVNNGTATKGPKTIHFDIDPQHIPDGFLRTDLWVTHGPPTLGGFRLSEVRTGTCSNHLRWHSCPETPAAVFGIPVGHQGIEHWTSTGEHWDAATATRCKGAAETWLRSSPVFKKMVEITWHQNTRVCCMLQISGDNMVINIAKKVAAGQIIRGRKEFSPIIYGAGKSKIREPARYAMSPVDDPGGLLLRPTSWQSI
ncbi:hypothetical protein Bbelb_019310 [Branchiostoma belcheri]|nr:hypothetical protein Bbelb_019310 [Branchiostoma belcheri]